jgi:hypothetical protein
MSRTIRVGDPLVFEGIRCTVIEVGGKTGKRVAFTADTDDAPFDLRTLELEEVAFLEAFQVWGHPQRLVAKPARPVLTTAGEG